MKDAVQSIADKRYERLYSEAYDKIKDAGNNAGSELLSSEGGLNGLKEPVVYVLGRDSNVGYASFDNDSNIVNQVAAVFPIFFFAVAALVCMTTMTRMVEDERTQIGVLKALGYSDGAVMAKYMFYSGSAG